MSEEWQAITVVTGVRERSAAATAVARGLGFERVWRGTAGCAAEPQAPQLLLVWRCSSPRSSRSCSLPPPSRASRSCSRSAASTISARSPRPELLPLHRQRAAARGVPSETNRQPMVLSKMSPCCPRPPSRSRMPASGSTAPSTTRASCARSARTHARSDVQGGSTITQELVRNLYIANQQKTLARKIPKRASPKVIPAPQTRGADPRRLPQRGVLRPSRLRRGGGLKHLFSGRAAKLTSSRPLSSPDCRRHPPCTTHSSTPGRPRPPQRGAAGDAEEQRHQQLRPPHRDQKKLALRPGHLYTRQQQPNFSGWATKELERRFGHRKFERGGLEGRQPSTRASKLWPSTPRVPSFAARQTRPRRSSRSTRATVT